MVYSLILAEVPRTHYAKNDDGLSVAYQVVGKGPNDIVLVLEASCIDLMWNDPASSRFREHLSHIGRVICIDWSGVGASDVIPLGALPTPELWSEDIRVVLDAVGSRRAFVFAMGAAGPLGLLFAAFHPDRTSGLVLADSSARTRKAEDYEIGWPDGMVDAYIDNVAEHWGSPDLFKLDNPSRRNDADYLGLRALDARLTMPPALARAGAEWTTHLDVRGILETVHTPTLVLHSAAYPKFPLEHGQYLAHHIDGAQFVPRNGSENFLYSLDEGNEVVNRMAEFITGAPPEIEPDRMLTTVMFIDIVGSTEHAARLGDTNWVHLLERHASLIEREIARGRGRKISSAGDGVLATFAGPARAVRCAQSIVASVRDLGMDVRAGIHTGEVQILGADIGGITVHIGARVSALASAGRVLVSSTVTELVRGSGIEFEDFGEHTLKGVPGSWRLFAVKD